MFQPEEWTFQRSSSPVRHQDDHPTTKTDKFYSNFVDNLHKPRVGRVRGIPKPPPGIFSGFLMVNKRTTSTCWKKEQSGHEHAREDVFMVMKGLRLWFYFSLDKWLVHCNKKKCIDCLLCMTSREDRPVLMKGLRLWWQDCYFSCWQMWLVHNESKMYCFLYWLFHFLYVSYVYCDECFWWNQWFKK